MADKSRINAALPIEVFFEWKDDQRVVDVVADQSHPSLTPCPELGCDVVHRRDTTLLHLSRDAPVECGRVDHDGKIRLSDDRFADETAIQTQDFGQAAQYLGDTDYGEIFGIDHRLATGRAHAIPAHAKKLNGWIAV